MNAMHIFTRNDSFRLRAAQKRDARRAGFSITELLVVVGIIVLLASLLLVAMGRVRTTALSSRTLSTMQGFAAACEAFQSEHGNYPGVLPERVLAQYTPEGDERLTGTQNALLHLMGGYRLRPPGTPDGSPTAIEYDDYSGTEYVFGTEPDLWRLKINPSDIGQGPYINGRSYAPYYTPGTNELATVSGLGNLPHLIDGWGQPIMYIRQIRTSGVLVGEIGDNERTQFLFGQDGNNDRMFGGLTAYLRSTNLGELAQNQQELSILNNADDRLATFAQIIRHPAFGEPDEPLHPSSTASRGSFILFSPGPDGVFFSIEDGPGRAGNPETNIVTGEFGRPQVVAEYDDLVFFGGG